VTDGTADFDSARRSFDSSAGCLNSEMEIGATMRTFLATLWGLVRGRPAENSALQEHNIATAVADQRLGQ
jgi:hypothetical protein